MMLFLPNLGITSFLRTHFQFWLHFSVWMFSFSMKNTEIEFKVSDDNSVTPLKVDLERSIKECIIYFQLVRSGRFYP